MMNNFTKEELNDLMDGLNVALNTDTGCDSTWRKDTHNLILKLKSMIDNYCEHDAIEAYVEKERGRITPLTIVAEYERLKKEMIQEDASFQFGKQCGYFAAICAIDNKIKSIKRIKGDLMIDYEKLINELIEAQIEYWTGLKIEKCQHESNGHKYHQPENGEAWIVNPGIPETYNKRLKCKKCEEFYK